MPGDMSWMKARYDELNEKSLLWEPPTLEGPNVPRCQMDGRPTIMLSANNYLNLTTHPKVVAAMQKLQPRTALEAARFVPLRERWTSTLKREKGREFKGVEASLIYSAGYTVNVGLIPSLVAGPQDVIISDELNHGSIIDGVRLTKASRAVYAHNDMGELEAVLKANESSDRKLIITDGVFSMDGDIAPLDEVRRSPKNTAPWSMLMTATAKVSSEKAGLVSLTTSNCKARLTSKPFVFQGLGCSRWYSGGDRNDPEPRPQPLTVLASLRSQPPGVAAAQKAAIEVLMSEPEHHARLWENTNYFRKELQSMGFDTGDSVTPIIPVMCGESSTAKAMTRALGEEGVMAGAIVFPMVARDKARIRTQMSAGLTREDLDAVLSCFEKVGPQVGVI